MTFLGLHPLDWLFIAGYFLLVAWMGRATRSSIHGQGDFFLAGRRMGRILQFFLNLGNMADATGAVQTSSIVYNQGAAGVWLGLQALFMTPYYWFMNAWFRRTRLTTIADIFTDRFGGRSLAMLFAATTILINIVSIGGGYLVAYKTIAVIMVKPPAVYTGQDRRSVEQFQDYTRLDGAYRHGHLDNQDSARYLHLRELHARGQLSSSISYIRPIPFYLLNAAMVAVYVILGGMKATALTDAFQGILTILFSLILIPFGIMRLGGTADFYHKIPARMLDLFDGGGGNDFTWYSILSIFIVSMVQIHVTAPLLVAGSARDEATASFGALSGGFMKRLLNIGWCFCGLIAFALFAGGLSDPDQVWGSLCNSLLGSGFIGLMLVGVLAANMAHLSGQCLNLSSLFVRNIYPVIFPRGSEQEGLVMGRILIVVTLLAGIGVALFFRDIFSFAKMWLTLNVAFGAAVLVIFKWRRVTHAAVWISVVLSLILIVGVPYAVPLIPSLDRLPALQRMTAERREVIDHAASTAALNGGRIGASTETVHVIAPQPIYFDGLVPDDSQRPNSPTHGVGRFQFEIYLMSLVGVDPTHLVPAQLLSLEYLFDSVFPFALLFGVSLVTRDRDPARTARFYAKMRTKVSADPEVDATNLAHALAHPASSEKIKLFPGSSWELQRWNRSDFYAFFGSCGIACGILAIFVALLDGKF